MVHRFLSVFTLIFTPLIIVCSQGGVLVLPAPVASIDAAATSQVAAEPQVESQYCSLDTLRKLAREIADNPADSPIAVEYFLNALRAASPEDLKSSGMVRLLMWFTGTRLVEQALEIVNLPDIYCVLNTIRNMVMDYSYREYLDFVSFCSIYMGELFSVEELRFIGLFFACARSNITWVEKEVDWFKEQGLFEKVMNAPRTYGAKLWSEEQTLHLTCGSLTGAHYCPLNAALDHSWATFSSKILIYLLQQGVRPDITDYNGDTAVTLVSHKRLFQEDIHPGLLWIRYEARIVILLFQKYAQKGNDGIPLLLQHIYRSRQMDDSAYSHKQEVIAGVALKMCPALASVQVVDKEGNNPLHAAVIADNACLAKRIYSANRELALIPNKRGETPLALARELGAWRALGGMARLNWIDKNPLLGDAIKADDEEVVRCIIIEAPKIYDAEEREEWIKRTGCASDQEQQRMNLKYALSKGKLKAALGMVKAAYFLERQREERASFSYKVATLKGQIEEAILPIRKLLSFFK